MHMPSVMARAADLIAGWRSGIDVSQIDLLTHPPRVKPPALVFQGDADVEVPLQMSRDSAFLTRVLGPGQHGEPITS